MKTEDRATKVARRFAELQVAAVKYAGAAAPSEIYQFASRSNDLAEAAAKYVLAIQNLARRGAK